MSDYDNLKLDRQLCFPLYVCSKEVINLYRPHLQKIGLTYTQYITMMVMWEYKQILARQLGEILYLDSGTLTPVLRKLESKGLITRERSEEDARDLVVTITNVGENLKDDAVKIPNALAMCVGNFERAAELKELLCDLMSTLTDLKKHKED